MKLAPSEKEILKLVAEGRRLKEIAVVRGTSWKTVNRQLGSIREKLNSRSAAQSVAIAMREGIIA